MMNLLAAYRSHLIRLCGKGKNGSVTRVTGICADGGSPVRLWKNTGSVEKKFTVLSSFCNISATSAV
jgi:hypothetical protein